MSDAWEIVSIRRTLSPHADRKVTLLNKATGRKITVSFWLFDDDTLDEVKERIASRAREKLVKEKRKGRSLELQPLFGTEVSLEE